MRERPTRVNNFDALRLFAATQVLIGHAAWHLQVEDQWWLAILRHVPGVPIFFVLSGFLISGSLDRNPEIRSYARNRCLRIFPALWCCLGATIVTVIILGYEVVHPSGLLWLATQMGGLIYTPGFLKDFGFGSYNGALWTIPIEIQFYVLLPLLNTAVNQAPAKFRVRLMAGIFGLLSLIGVMCHVTLETQRATGAFLFEYKLLKSSFIPHLYLFLLGVLIRRLDLHRSAILSGRGGLWLLAYATFAAMFSDPILQVPKMLLLGITTISLAYTIPTLSGRLLRHQDISYGVYIYHGLVINVFVEFGMRGQWRYFAAVLGLTFLLGVLSWVFVEKPALRMKR